MKYKKILLSSGLTTLLALGTACSGNKTAERSPVETSGDAKGTAPSAQQAKKDDSALVRFVNATPSSKDLAFGDLTPFANVGARDITEYKSLPAARHDFKLITNGNTGQAMATDSEGLSAGTHYTVLAVTEKDGTFTLNNVKDDLVPPAPGMAKVRVINLAPSVKDVDLYVGTKKDALISGAGLNHPSDYKEVSPSEGTLNIRNTMSKKNAETVKDLQLEAGKLYTILVFGNRDGKLKVKTVEDVFTQAPNGTKS